VRVGHHSMWTGGASTLFHSEKDVIIDCGISWNGPSQREREFHVRVRNPPGLKSRGKREEMREKGGKRGNW